MIFFSCNFQSLYSHLTVHFILVQIKSISCNEFKYNGGWNWKFSKLLHWIAFTLMDWQNATGLRRKSSQIKRRRKNRISNCHFDELEFKFDDITNAMHVFPAELSMPKRKTACGMRKSQRWIRIGIIYIQSKQNQLLAKKRGYKWQLACSK